MISSSCRFYLLLLKRLSCSIVAHYRLYDGLVMGACMTRRNMCILSYAGLGQRLSIAAER
jgi:hypothetical protein